MVDIFALTNHWIFIRFCNWDFDDTHKNWFRKDFSDTLKRVENYQTQRIKKKAKG